MSNQTINAEDLAKLPTLITGFMCDRTTNMKTYDDLVDIFESCYRNFNADNDKSDDLRILRFEESMRLGQWTGSIEITRDRQAMIVTDGIHRGVAYLRCVGSGVPEDNLPPLMLIDKDTL